MSETRWATDRGELRDKVVAGDPAVAPMDTDAEAAGTPTPRAEAAASLAQQMKYALEAVPILDRSRVAGGTVPFEPFEPFEAPKLSWWRWRYR